MAQGIGGALLLACCNPFFYLGYNDTGEVSTPVKPLSIPLQADEKQINSSYSPLRDKLLKDTVFLSTIGNIKIKNIGIPHPTNAKNDKSEIILKMTKEFEGNNAEEEEELLLKIPTLHTNGFPQGSNILQINIYNNNNDGGKGQAEDENVLEPVPSTEQQEKDLTLSNTQEKKMKKENKKDEPLSWWQTEIVYQIYPRSFYDKVQPFGIGDIAGITEKVDYFQRLGIGIIWISPIFESPMADFGYDVSNFTDIDPIFGNLEDFDNMIKVFHAKNIRIVMDFIPNHSSDEHDWFQRSLKKEAPYTDYYVWRSANGTDEQGNPLPPNNWLSVFGGSAWTWSEQRKQFYLHQFVDKQPDLNFRNPAVVEEMNNVVKFWLDRGVDGFRVDAIKHLFEVEDMSQDEPLSENPDVEDPKEYGYLNHTLTVSQPEMFDILREWRRIMDTYTDKVMMTESYDEINDVMKYYGTKDNPIAHFPFNFFLITELSNRSSISGHSMKAVINLWLDNMPEGGWPNWVQGNHDRGRIASRLGDDLVDALNMITLLLPGTPVTYYGEEIGMTDTTVSYVETQDPFGCNFGQERYEEFSRDPERSPMQWNAGNMAGFTESNTTWLPINSNYKQVNVKAQLTAHHSHIKVYKQLAKLRKEGVFQRGDISFPFVNNDILSFVRDGYKKQAPHLVIVNLSEDEQVVNLHNNANFNMPDQGEVVVRSSADSRSDTEPGSILSLRHLPLMPGEGLVLKLQK